MFLSVFFDPDADQDPACHFDADPDPVCHFDANPDLDPTFYLDAGPDLDPDPSFQIKAQNLKKSSNMLILHILACHLQIDADPDPYPSYRITLMWLRIHLFTVMRMLMRMLMRIRILPFNLMRIRIHNTGFCTYYSMF
jgi:hypothetical protein